jgi:hypothetical protein
MSFVSVFLIGLLISLVSYSFVYFKKFRINKLLNLYENKETFQFDFKKNYSIFLKYNKYLKNVDIDRNKYVFLMKKFLIKDRILELYNSSDKIRISYNSVDLNDKSLKLINIKKIMMALVFEVKLFTYLDQDYYLINHIKYSHDREKDICYFVPHNHIEIFINQLMIDFFEVDYTNQKSVKMKTIRTILNF